MREAQLDANGPILSVLAKVAFDGLAHFFVEVDPGNLEGTGLHTGTATDAFGPVDVPDAGRAVDALRFIPLGAGVVAFRLITLLAKEGLPEAETTEEIVLLPFDAR
jgi:hypothetical protein